MECTPISNRLMEVASSTTGLYTLSTAKVKAIEIPIPPLDEQREIVAGIESKSSVLDALATAFEATASRTNSLRRGVGRCVQWGPLVGAIR